MNRRDRRRAAAEQRHEDKNIARRMVMDDARRAGRSLREFKAEDDARVDALTFDEPMPDDPSGGDGMLVNLVIGTRDKLTMEEAKAAADKWLEVTRKYPKCEVYVNLLGYDEDPREIPQIEMAAEYVRQWARFADINDFEATAAGPLGPLGTAFLGACGVFGEKIRRKIKVTPRPAEH